MLDNVDDYDNIVVAGPIWCGTYPMAIFTLLDNLDLSDKNIFPVTTHEGSGLASTVRDLEKNYQGINIKNKLAVYGSNINDSKEQIRNWAINNLQ